MNIIVLENEKGYKYFVRVKKTTKEKYHGLTLYFGAKEIIKLNNIYWSFYKDEYTILSKHKSMKDLFIHYPELMLL